MTANLHHFNTNLLKDHNFPKLQFHFQRFLSRLFVITELLIIWSSYIWIKLFEILTILTQKCMQCFLKMSQRYDCPWKLLNLVYFFFLVVPIPRNSVLLTCYGIAANVSVFYRRRVHLLQWKVMRAAWNNNSNDKNNNNSN